MLIVLAIMQFSGFILTAIMAMRFGMSLANGTHLDQLFYASLMVCFAALTVFSRLIITLTDSINADEEQE